MRASYAFPEGLITAESFAIKHFVKKGTIFIKQFDVVRVPCFPVVAPKLNSEAVGSANESWSVFGVAVYEEVITPSLGIPDTA